VISELEMDTTERNTSGALIVAGRPLTPGLFIGPDTSERVDDVLAALEREVRAVPRDISTAEGRAAIASVAYKIARSKTALDELGKNVVADWRRQSELVDTERRKIRQRCDALKDEFRQPLTEWENDEKERVAAHEAMLREIEALGRFDDFADLTSDLVLVRIAGLGRLYGRPWEEFAVRAAQTCDAATLRLERKLAECRKAEALAAELERQRLEEDERVLREREDRIAAEARREAEERAAAADRARRKVAEERAEAERVAGHEAALAKVRSYATVDGARSSEQLEWALESLESISRDWQEFAEEARQAYENARGSVAGKIVAARIREARDRQDREARIAADAAAAERQRIADEQAAAAAEAERRENNERIRASVNNTAAGDIVQAGGVSMDVAKAIVTAIAQGRVRHVRIEY